LALNYERAVKGDFSIIPKGNISAICIKIIIDINMF